MKTKKALRHKTLLIIMDGVGVNPSKKNNAVLEANTTRLDESLWSSRWITQGNSDVGHLTIGCGTIIEQDLVRIDKAIEDDSFSQNYVPRTAIVDAKKFNFN